MQSNRIERPIARLLCRWPRSSLLSQSHLNRSRDIRCHKMLRSFSHSACAFVGPRGRSLPQKKSMQSRRRFAWSKRDTLPALACRSRHAVSAIYSSEAFSSLVDDPIPSGRSGVSYGSTTDVNALPHPVHALAKVLMNCLAAYWDAPNSIPNCSPCSGACHRNCSHSSRTT